MCQVTELSGYGKRAQAEHARRMLCSIKCSVIEGKCRIVPVAELNQVMITLQPYLPRRSFVHRVMGMDG